MEPLRASGFRVASRSDAGASRARTSSISSSLSLSASGSTTCSTVAWIRTPSTSARSEVETSDHAATYTTAHFVPLARVRSQPMENVFSPVQMMNSASIASPKVSKVARESGAASPYAPPNSCMPRIANTVRNSENTRQKERMRRTPLITAAKTWRKALCLLSPLSPAKMRSTRSMRSVAMPSAPAPTASSTTPLTTTAPSTTFQGFDQYFRGPTARCFVTNSAMNTLVNTVSHVFSAA